MTIDDIKRIIAKDEHRTLELKKTTGELKDGMHTACAFLNTDGGWLIFGIAPVSLNIVGQEVTENIREPHLSYPYNTIMADVLFKTTFLEQWGSGARRIIQACREQEVPEPVWREQGGFVVITFTRRKKTVPVFPSNADLLFESIPTLQKLFIGREQYIQRLINSLKTGELSSRKLHEAMNCSPRSVQLFIKQYLAPMLSEGLIEQTYPDSPHHPKQKYKLTEKGRLFLQKINEELNNNQSEQ